MDLKTEEKKKSKKGKVIAIFAASLLLAMVAGAGIAYLTMSMMGKSNLDKVVAAEAPELVQVETEEIKEEEKAIWKDGWIKYNGKVYEYNEDIMTFLFMGIDKNKDVKEVSEGTNGGQADALFLAVLNNKDKSIKIIGINRNTMTDVDIYDEYGSYVTTMNAQIAVQHGFGNGVEESCEYQVKAVRKLIYNMPIHGYAAINMSAISTINDTVGGIDLVALEDVRNSGGRTIIKAGDEVHLEGDAAFWYVKYRNVDNFASADGRLERQKQYLTAFVNKAKEEAKSNIGIVLDLYNAITSKMVTSITADEVAYLAPKITNYSFDMDGLVSIQGETVMGEEFEEFYVDETALYELILDVFYDEVELGE